MTCAHTCEHSLNANLSSSTFILPKVNADDIILWSQIIYGHRTAYISPKFVRFYSAQTDNFGLTFKLMISTAFILAPYGPSRASYDVWNAPGTFKNRKQCLSGYRPMFYESNYHWWEATCICRSTYSIYMYIDILLMKTKSTCINTKIYISLELLRMNNMQRMQAGHLTMSYGARPGISRCNHKQTPAGARTICHNAIEIS